MKLWYMYDTNITGHFLTPLYCIFLYGSATSGGAGFSSLVLRFPWLTGLGEYALPAYLWSEFMARVVGGAYYGPNSLTLTSAAAAAAPLLTTQV